MILHALKGYYDRVKDELAPEGFEARGIEFVIVIDKNGKYRDVVDMRQNNGKRLIAKTFILPRSVGRSGSNSYKTTFLLWDHIGYVLGLPKKGKDANEIQKNEKLAKKQFDAWLDNIKNLSDELKMDEGVSAVVKFYETDEYKKAIEKAIKEEYSKNITCNMSFMLDTDETILVPCRESVKNYINKNLNNAENYGDEDISENGINYKVGNCMVTGETGDIARTHGKTFISKDSNSLVAFQKNSGYDSYGKEQGYNAPIIKSTEFAYTTALKNLLNSTTQQMLIGDSKKGIKAVFWSEKKTQFEDDFSCFFSEIKDDPSENVRAISTLLNSPQTGAYYDDDSNTKFFLLGLAQGGGKRICVKCWKVGTVSEFARNIRQHFEDLEIDKHPNEPQYYSLWRLLVNSAIEDDIEKLPPNIAGDFMRTIMDGTPYPATILQLVLRRIKSDGGNVKPVRAALVKAYLNRYFRQPNQNGKELSVSLDKEQFSNGYGYLLGCLFAVLEKIQEEANSGATIRERYYGSACASPVVVFPTLMRLKNHHLAKLEKGRVIYFEKIIGEIIKKPFDNFPKYLDLYEQGKFAIGYYHQRQDFFHKKPKEANNG